MDVLGSVTLFVIMLALAAMPSASVAIVVARSATHGFKHGVSVSLGIVLADLIFVLLALFGLSAFAEAMGSFFLVVKYLGAIYLLWLGYSLLSSNKATIKLTISPVKGNDIAVSFFAGFVLTLGDIKAIFFYASLLPMFVDVVAVRMLDVFIISIITILSVGGVKLAYVILSKNILASVAGSPHKSLANKIVGGFMLGAGGYLIAKS
jgi:threonine/homoserine/homoserine lactone efflux protein